MEEIRYTFDSPEYFGIDMLEAERVSQGDQARRRLLAHALKINDELFPGIAPEIRTAARRIGLDPAPPGFVINDRNVNAFCISWSLAGKDEFAVGLTSGLIELLDLPELRFVIGHEIGHFAYQHYVYPAADTVGEFGTRLAVLHLQRAAEISADRVGLVATDSMEAACGAMIKTACGLGEPHLRLHVPSILEQFRELSNQTEGHCDSIFESHPMISMRVRSLIRFSSSKEYFSISGKDSNDARGTLRTIDESIRNDFEKASGFAHDSWEDNALKDLRFWAVLTLFVADGRLTKDEQQILEKHFGEIDACKAIAYIRGEGTVAREKVTQRFQETCHEIGKIDAQKKRELFEELERIASTASGELNEIEDSLRTIGRGLEIYRSPRVRPREPGHRREHGRLDQPRDSS